jgi:hypothetical protein
MLNQLGVLLSMYRCPYQLDIPMLNGKQYGKIVMWGRDNVTARQDREVATQENMDSIVNDGGANSLIILATKGLMDLAAAAASTSEEEALRLQ